MEEFITLALKSPFGGFAFVVGLLYSMCWSVYKVTRHVSEWHIKLSSVDKVEEKLDSIIKEMAFFNGFIKLYNEKNNQFAKAQSPMKLTDAGIRVHKDLDIKSIVISHWDKIEEELKNELHMDCNPYDIQQASIKIASTIQKHLTQSEISSIKTYAFNNGHNLADYDMLIGIEIRDNYFKNHAIDLDEVDKHDPNKDKSI